MSVSDTQHTPNPIDLHVGARCRMRRKLLGVSQERLADALGLTFQQVQKYERGANRISCSKLWAISKFLAVEPGWFFEGIELQGSGPGVTEDPREAAIAAFLITPEGVELAHLAPSLPAAGRRQILELARYMAGTIPSAEAA